MTEGDLERIVLPDVTKMALDQPLDPARIKKRAGRGSGQFSYLETHDVKRTMNLLFGYDAWGYAIVTQEEIAAVEVEKDNRSGWHVGYRCVVRLTIKGFPDTDGSGYGDATEYGPAARVTACELAIKESESDALKRACTKLGDQLGLGLYEKDGGAVRARERREEGGLGPTPVPRSWTKVRELVETFSGDSWMLFEAFVRAASYHLYGETESKKLTTDQRKVMLQKAAGAAVWLNDNPQTEALGTHASVEHFAKGWAHVLDGQVLEVPDYTPPENPVSDSVDDEAAKIADEVFEAPA